MFDWLGCVHSLLAQRVQLRDDGLPGGDKLSASAGKPFVSVFNDFGLKVWPDAFPNCRT